MIELRWSESLAKLAQQRADTCLFEHGDLQLNGDPVGQNLAILYSNANNLRLNITYMMDLWYNEVFQYGYKEGFEPNSGHYSQLIWGNTREVGCGYTYFKEDGFYKMYFVCDYYPPGNYIGQKPYVYGKHNCKEHGLQQSPRYSKLCVVDDKETRVCKLEGSETTHGRSTPMPLDNEVSVEVSTNYTTSNETSSESAEDNDDIDGADEVVTVSYGTLDETEVGKNETGSAVTESVPCNDMSSKECTQAVSNPCELNASVEKEYGFKTITPDKHRLCLDNQTSNDELLKSIQRLYRNLGALKDMLVRPEGNTSNNTTDFETGTVDDLNTSEAKRNGTLVILYDSIKLADEILDFFTKPSTSTTE